MFKKGRGCFKKLKNVDVVKIKDVVVLKIIFKGPGFLKTELKDIDFFFKKIKVVDVLKIMYKGRGFKKK